MATPIVAVYAAAVNAATVNKYVSAGGDKINAKLNYARIRYNGASWEVHATTDSSEIVSGDVAWSTNLINITLTGYTVIPVAVVAPMLADATILPKVLGNTITQIQVAFYDFAGVRVTVQATSMDFYIIVLGV